MHLRRAYPCSPPAPQPRAPPAPRQPLSLPPPIETQAISQNNDHGNQIAESIPCALTTVVSMSSRTTPLSSALSLPEHTSNLSETSPEITAWWGFACALTEILEALTDALRNLLPLLLNLGEPFLARALQLSFVRRKAELQPANTKPTRQPNTRIAQALPANNSAIQAVVEVACALTAPLQPSACSP